MNLIDIHVSLNVWSQTKTEDEPECAGEVSRLPLLLLKIFKLIFEQKM